MAKNRQTLEEMADSLYDDPELSAAVVADCDRLGNRQSVLSGEKVLPHPIDARRWFDRFTGRAVATPTERSQSNEIDVLKDRLAALEKLIATNKGA